MYCGRCKDTFVLYVSKLYVGSDGLEVLFLVSLSLWMEEWRDVHMHKTRTNVYGIPFLWIVWHDMIFHTPLYEKHSCSSAGITPIFVSVISFQRRKQGT